MASITSPVEGFTGNVVGVQFEDGHGSTDDEAQLAYFERAGYTVDGAAEDSGIETDDTEYLANPAGAVGTPVDNPPGPLDAADPDNDLVPVGGVKSAISPGSPVGRSSRGKRVRQNTTDQPADITPTVPVAAQDNVQSAPSATPVTTPSAAPVGDGSAPDYTSATPAPDPSKPAVSTSTVKDASVQDEKDTTSDAAAPEDAKAGDQSPTGQAAATDSTKKG